MPTVQMPDGALVEMPDNPTPQQLAELSLYSRGPMSAPAGASAPPAPAAASGTDIFLRRLGILGRGAATGVTGTVGMMGDALNSALNLIPGVNLQMPSKVIQNSMTQMGLPTPDTLDEKIMGGLAAVGGGMLDPAMTGITNAITRSPALGGGAAPLYTPPPQQSVAAHTIEQAKKEGLQVPPSVTNTSKTGRLLEAVGGPLPVRQRMQYNNMGVTGDIVRREVGLPKDAPLTPESLKQLIDSTADTGYRPIEQVGHIPTSGGYINDLADIVRSNQGVNGSFPGAGNDDVLNLVRNYAVPGFDGRDAVTAIKNLRAASRDAYNASDSVMGKVNRDVADAIERQIEAHLNNSSTIIFPNGGNRGMTGSELLDAFRNARTQLAKQYAVRDALVPGSGEINASAFRGNPALTGGLRTLGDLAGLNRGLLGYSAAKPAPFTNMEAGLGMAAAASALHGNMPTAAGMAAIPMARFGARELLTSPMGQELFAQPAAPFVANQVNPLLRALPTIVNGGLWSQQ